MWSDWLFFFVIMISVCLPTDALWQHIPAYLGFSYVGHQLSFHGCFSKAQLLLFTLDEEYLLTAPPPDLERVVASLSPPLPAQPLLLGRGVAPLGCHPWPCAWGSSSQLLLYHRSLALSVTAPGLEHILKTMEMLTVIIFLLDKYLMRSI